MQCFSLRAGLRFKESAFPYQCSQCIHLIIHYIERSSTKMVTFHHAGFQQVLKSSMLSAFESPNKIQQNKQKGPVILHLGGNETKQVQRRAAFLITPVHAHRLLDHRENPGSREDFHPNMWKPQIVLAILAQMVNKPCSRKDFSIFAQLSNVFLDRRRWQSTTNDLTWPES